jgi:2-dehydropantoate 2-reductase
MKFRFKNGENMKKKIAVIGIGGIGGYVGALLAEKYSDVTLVARGARKTLLENEGLTLHSEYRGEHAVKPVKVVESSLELEPMDYIFICVKNYSLESVCKDLKNCVKDGTVIVPIMNGVDPGDRTREFLHKYGITGGLVIDSLIYIVSFIDKDGSIQQQGNYGYMYVGIQNSSDNEWARSCEVSELLDNALIDCTPARDIQREIWRKYMLNAAYNVETARYNNSIGQLRDDPVKAKQHEDLIWEAYAVAKAKNVDVRKDDAEAIIHRFYYEFKYDATSSLQRDIVAGRQSELETFCGYLVREGAKLGLSLPVTTEMYEALKKL